MRERLVDRLAELYGEENVVTHCGGVVIAMEEP